MSKLLLIAFNRKQKTVFKRMETMIEVQDLTKYYGPHLAVSRLDFQVAAGEIVGFLGPNGAGKTTTLKILAGFLAPSAGTARINGFDCVSDSLAVRRSLGYVPENVSIYPDLTVTQFLAFAARAKGIAAKEEKRELDRVVASCGLEEVRHTLVAALSKGFRQRLGLAQALLNQPPLLILDEPTIGLDPSQIVEIRQMIKNLEGDHTVMLSSHILPEVSQLCDRVIIINRGQIVASDRPENLSRQLGHGSRVLLTVGGPPVEVEAALKISGVNRVLSQGENKYLVEADLSREFRPELARLVVAQGWDLLEMKTQEFTLEEVFLNLVTEENHEAA
jgi:ABC-2 type transport system ATP-binding protein